jgi:hypothetical protein
MSLSDRLRFARLKLFQSSLAPISARARRRRFDQFRELMDLRADMRILDIGGSANTWMIAEDPLDITILNLPGHTYRMAAPPHRIAYVEGDGCSMPQFSPGDFDIVFSNSVIEHVGPRERQDAFAAEVRRLGERYWVQTPAKWFPLEPHCGMPFWWFYPESWRQWFIRRWREELPPWTEMVEGTRVIEKSDFATMFPNAHIMTERFWTIPKSYMAASVISK